MNEKLITVFTPTYNRADFLVHLYESLRKQRVYNFEWLIVDDGSTDNTEKIVSEFKENSDFKIIYIYKKNQGLSSGYNVAIENLNTELAVCVDSDDQLYDENTTKIIEEKWKKYSRDNFIAGIVGNDADLNGKILGYFYTDGEILDFLKYETRKEKKADVKIVVRSELYKEVAPVKIYDSERGISPHILHMKLCEKYKFKTIGEPLCRVDYQETGMTASIWKQYLSSPLSFADLKLYCIQKEHSGLIRKILNVVHYDACCILTGRKIKTENLFINICAIVLFPIGYILSIIIKRKGSKK